MYLTPKRLRHMGLGVDLSAKTDAELAEQIRSATAAVDAFCNVPTTPVPYSFKGGSITGERHSWGQYNRNHRVYPYHQPVREVTGFRILATESLYIDFPETTDYYVNGDEGYIEIINFALTKIGLWGQANVPQMGLIDPVAILDYTYGRRIPVVDDEIYAINPTASGDEDFEFMAQDGYWWPDSDVTVKLDGDELDSGDYTLDRSGGFITIPTATATSEVTASYDYRIPREVVRATALGTVAFLGEARLAAANMTGIESLKAEELEIRRIGSRSGAEKGVSLPAAAQGLLSGYQFWTVR